jgi:hypothetical protein
VQLFYWRNFYRWDVGRAHVQHGRAGRFLPQVVAVQERPLRPEEGAALTVFSSCFLDPKTTVIGTLDSLFEISSNNEDYDVFKRTNVML